MYVKKLDKKDVRSFRQIRLQALEQVPEAFAASFEEEVDKPIAFFEIKLTEMNFYGMFHQNELLGIVSLTRSSILKMNHKAAIGSVYVKKEGRGKGIGTKLLGYVIETAENEGIEQVQLVVAANNERAKQIYESLGFESYGYEKNALKVNGAYIDEEYMVKMLKSEKKK